MEESVLLTIEKPDRYSCPYCDQEAASPGGIKFHVRSKHPDKQEEFLQKHYPEMEKRFKGAVKEHERAVQDRELKAPP